MPHFKYTAKSSDGKTVNGTLEAHDKKTLVQPILNHLQIGISLSYVLLSDCPQEKMLTVISVLHDLRALEPLRKNLPHVYSAVVKRAMISEAGRFYLLDTINGYSNA